MKIAYIILLLLNIFSVKVFSEPLQIGAIYGLSGSLSSFGEEYKNSALLAAIDYEDHIKITFEDSAWDSKSAVVAYHKLAGAGIKIFHVMGSGMSLAIKPLTERKKFLLFSAAAHPDVLPNSSNVVRHGNQADHDAKTLAKSVLLHQPKTITAIFIQNDWGELYNSKLSQEINANRTINFYSNSYTPGTTDFRSMLLPLLNHKPDVFIVNSFGTAAGQIINQLRQLGFEGHIFANNGFVLSNDSILTLGDKTISGLYFQDYPDLPTEFCIRYQSEFKKVPGYLALAAYTDMELLAQASTKVGNSCEAISKHIRSLKKFKGKYDSIKISSAGDMLVDTVIREWSAEEYTKRINPVCR